ncbi:XLF-domain-containing protein [Rhizodiscina lignyota]|uniref:Non-homologous end-joining factor 1 n=1 Tax=Rhizodiscina lignyota TaxID=1504668 RepID=A0A9P4IAI9_9PEZI|nr:XLF-domain-containing protein [Rhizodiscina lignyota]
MSWKPIRIANSSNNTPQLLIKYDFTSAGYTVWLTDLSRIWTETLDRRQLVLRALTDNTSIDPSEDTSQLRILLTKVKDALDGVEGTSAQVTAEAEDSLVLETYSTLPPPLESLRWRVELSLLSQEHLKPYVTQPLVQHLHTLCRQQDDLIRQLHDKDVVISKLLDKLEAIGTDVADVFPSAAGRKSSQRSMSREQAGQYVKGLGRFDERQWLQKSNTNPAVVSQNQMVEEVFEKGILSLQGNVEATSDSWWEHLQEKDLVAASRETSLSLRSKSKEPTSKKRRLEDIDSEDEAVDTSEFQRQATPPAIRQAKQDNLNGASDPAKSNGAAAPKDDGSETETEDDDLDAVVKPIKPKIQPPRTSPRKSPPLSSKKKLGRIGGSREKTPAQDLGFLESAPQHGAGIDDENQDTEDAPKPAPATKIQAKRKLGIIGGKAAKSQTPEPSAQPTTPKKVLGKIGGKKSTPPKTSEARQSNVLPTTEIELNRNSEKPGAKATQNEQTLAPDVPRESSQERADRKREELKRQLEAKAQAPAKKKRRF